MFLHGGWRCGSTYIWSRFRCSPQAMCFYEPFHEMLAWCNTRKIRRVTSASWDSRHPPLDRPYRSEYGSLIWWRGVPGYREDFAVARYFPGADGAKREICYLRRLLDHASRAGKRAVLGFSRSLARSGALKRALGGYHILLVRDAVQQWLSCRSYRIGQADAYFELCHFLILALAPPESPAGRLAQRLGLPRPRPRRFREQLEFMLRALSPWSEELSFRAFFAVYALSYRLARTHADLTLDVDRLYESADYRGAVCSTILARTGLAITFDECRRGWHEPDQVPLDFAALKNEVLAMLCECGAHCGATVQRGSVAPRQKLMEQGG